ncbi:MAG: regulatory iron-sulfur-containing complex subunit RicT [Gemmatimonadales bacterium]
MPTTVEVRFKGNRKDYFLWPDEAERLCLHQPVIVEAERGVDFGRVGVVGDVAASKCAAGCSGCAVGGEPPTASRNVIRTASQEDIRAANDLRRSEEPTRIRATERVRHHGLEMKVSDAEWQWDRKKLTFYFTAEKRVDFRDLVRDLAATFKTRIELRQIGVRDEAARLGGVGRCGKEYCCSTWLRSLDPVSLALAKDQHLSLNPAQISGGCGRLLCCLKYEHEFYVASRKRFPREGKLIRTMQGGEKVIAVDIFRERVFLRGENGHRTVQLADLREEMARAAELPPEELAALTVRRERPSRGQERPRPPRDGGGDRPRDGDRSRDGDRTRPDGAGSRPDGERARREGDRTRSEGARARPDGDRTRADGDRSRTDGDRSRRGGDRRDRPADRSDQPGTAGSEAREPADGRAREGGSPADRRDRPRRDGERRRPRPDGPPGERPPREPRADAANEEPAGTGPDESGGPEDARAEGRRGGRNRAARCCRGRGPGSPDSGGAPDGEA